MAISTAYKSGTVSSSSGTTFTATTSTFASGDVGRILILTSGSGKLQHRKIASYTSTTVVELDHAFNTTPWLDTVSDVNPANGDSFVVSYLQSDATFTGETGVTASGEQIDISALDLSGGAYVHITNAQVDLDSDGVQIGTGAGMIFGWYNYIAGEDAQVKDSCHIIDRTSQTTGGNQMARGTTAGADFGMLDIYGGAIVRDTGAVCFWRCYYDTSSADCQCRWINVQCFGDAGLGSRVDGDRSIVITEQVGARTTFGICNPRTAVSRTEFTAVDCDQAVYVWLDPTNGGPTGRAVLNRLNTINVKVMRASKFQGTGATGTYEIIGKKSEIDAAPTFIAFDGTATITDHRFRYGNIIKPSFFDDTATKITASIKTVLKDTNGTTTNTETVTTGDYTEHFDRHTDITPPYSGNVNLSGGTQYAPYKLTCFSFGKALFTQTIDLEDEFSSPLTLLDEILLTETVKATIDAYTGYETVAKGFDGAYNLLYDNLASEESYYISRVGEQYDFTGASATTIVYDSTAVSKIDYTGTTITFDHASDFTGGCTGTGSFTIQGALGLNGGTFDNSGGVIYNTSDTNVDNITVSNEFRDDSARTLTMSNCTIDTIRSTQGALLVINAVNTTITNNPDGVTINNSVNLSVDSLVTGSAVRIEKTSDGSLISEGLEATTEYTDTYNFTSDVPVKIIVRKYGYKTNEFNGTITSSGLTASAAQIADSFVVASEVTADAYTGITESFSAGTVSIGETHTLQELYDYLSVKAADVTNLQYDTLISTVNGVDRIGTFDLTVDATFSLDATGTTVETLDISSNTLTLNGDYGDYLRIIHTGGTQKTIRLTNVTSGRVYRIEKQSDQSLVYEGTSSGTTVSIKHLWTTDVASKLITTAYAYDRFNTLFTIDNTVQSIQINNTADSFTAVNEATASAYTGITLNFSAATGSLSTSHTVQEIYDYHSYQQAQLSNLTYDPIITTSNGIEVHFENAFTVGVGGTLTSSSQTVNLDASDSITTSGGGAVSADVNVQGGGQMVLADLDDMTGTLSITSTGDVEIAAVGTAPSGSAGSTATLEVTTASPGDTFDFTAFTFDASTVVENSSANNITIDIGAGNTVPTKLETSGTITFTQNAIVAASSLIDGTRVRLYNVTKAAELDNSVVSGGAGYSYTADTATAGVDVGDVLRLDHIYVSGVTCKQRESLTATLTASGLSFNTTQDDCPVYNTNAIDGSTVAEFTTDYPNVQVDIDDPDNQTTVQRIYAWYTYTESTEDGIRNYFKGITAEDTVNYKVNTSIVDLKLDNVDPSNAVILSGGRLYRDDDATIVASGSTSIEIQPGRAYLAAEQIGTVDANVTQVNSTSTSGVSDFKAKATIAL